MRKEKLLSLFAEFAAEPGSARASLHAAIATADAAEAAYDAIVEGALDAEIEAMLADFRAAEAAVREARIILRSSPQGCVYVLEDIESGEKEAFLASSMKEARSEADDFASGLYEPSGSQQWVDIRIYPEWRGELEEEHTATIDPLEPDCSEEAHEWVEGQVSGHGGGVLIRSTCAHCGLQRTHDTWSQRSDTGEQGLSSLSYRPAYP